MRLVLDDLNQIQPPVISNSWSKIKKPSQASTPGGRKPPKDRPGTDFAIKRSLIKTIRMVCSVGLATCVTGQIMTDRNRELTAQFHLLMQSEEPLPHQSWTESLLRHGKRDHPRQHESLYSARLWYGQLPYSPFFPPPLELSCIFMQVESTLRFSMSASPESI